MAHVLLHRVSQSLGLIRGCGDENGMEHGFYGVNSYTRLISSRDLSCNERKA